MSNEDHMKSGQLKRAYNVQISTENQFIHNSRFIKPPTILRLQLRIWENIGEEKFSEIESLTADAGYGSERKLRTFEAK